MTDGVAAKMKLRLTSEIEARIVGEGILRKMSETPLQLKAEGLANLRETLKEHEGKRIILMFFGSILEEGDHIGESWCPDCRDGRQST